MKPFPTARPSPAPLQPSLHPPFPRFGQCTNMTDTLMLRCATLGSTLCCWPDLQPVDGLREPKRCQSFSRFPPAVLLPQTSRLSCMSLVRVFHEHLAGELMMDGQSERASRHAACRPPAYIRVSFSPLPFVHPKNMHAHIYTCTYIYTSVHIYIYPYMHKYTHAYIHTLIDVAFITLRNNSVALLETLYT